MVKWQLSNASTLLEKIRSVLGGSERPDQLYWYTGVMPVVDVVGISPGIPKTVLLATLATASTGVNSANITLPPAGKKWKVIAISVSISAAAVGTLIGAGLNLVGGNNFWFYENPVGISTNVATPLGNVQFGVPFYIYDTDNANVIQVLAQLSAWTGAASIQFVAVVEELNSTVLT